MSSDSMMLSPARIKWYVLPRPFVQGNMTRPLACAPDDPSKAAAVVVQDKLSSKNVLRSLQFSASSLDAVPLVVIGTFIDSRLDIDGREHGEANADL